MNEARQPGNNGKDNPLGSEVVEPVLVPGRHFPPVKKREDKDRKDRVLGLIMPGQRGIGAGIVDISSLPPSLWIR
jgi:hypothetical protein